MEILLEILGKLPLMILYAIMLFLAAIVIKGWISQIWERIKGDSFGYRELYKKIRRQIGRKKARQEIRQRIKCIIEVRAYIEANLPAQNDLGNLLKDMLKRNNALEVAIRTRESYRNDSLAQIKKIQPKMHNSVQGITYLNAVLDEEAINEHKMNYANCRKAATNFSAAYDKFAGCIDEMNKLLADLRNNLVNSQQYTEIYTEIYKRSRAAGEEMGTSYALFGNNHNASLEEVETFEQKRRRYQMK